MFQALDDFKARLSSSAICHTVSYVYVRAVYERPIKVCGTCVSCGCRV